MMFRQAEKHGKRPFLWAKRDGKYQSQSWLEVRDAIVTMALALKRLGVQAGDRVAIVSENRPEWLIADHAIMAIGAISVPVYTTYAPRDYRHVLENSGASAVIISTARLARLVLTAAHHVDSCRHAITIEEPQVKQHLNLSIENWDALMNEDVATDEQRKEMIEGAGSASRNDVACLIYTSGTGGAPRGVMQHHGSILHNCAGAAEVMKSYGLGDDRFLSFLPLSHAYEHSAGQFFPIFLSAEIYYAEGLDKLATNMGEARPTVMVVVPRLFEVLRTRIQRTIAKESLTKQKLFKRSMALGTKAFKSPGSLGFFERLQFGFLDRTVRKKARGRFGGKLKAMVSGGAPLNPEVGEFFAGLGLDIVQGYGQTESGPVISVNRPELIKMDTVGPPLANTTVKIADDGEILVRGELVMHGYWRDEDSTKAVLRDGWLHTGDIGLIDADGHLKITDRKRDIIVNDKGENISPQRIEGMLALENEIAQAMVYGDKKPYIVGLIVPDSEWIAEWAPAQNLSTDPSVLKTEKAFLKALDEAVGRINRKLGNLEKVRRFLVADAPFDIENGQMTPTLKIRRHIIAKAYKDRLESLYKSN
ncbi:MAG: long-chain fatty acid--CoA ligase [Pseudomonadota bacterium]